MRDTNSWRVKTSVTLKLSPVGSRTNTLRFCSSENKLFWWQSKESCMLCYYHRRQALTCDKQHNCFLNICETHHVKKRSYRLSVTACVFNNTEANTRDHHVILRRHHYYKEIIHSSSGLPQPRLLHWIYTQVNQHTTKIYKTFSLNNVNTLLLFFWLTFAGDDSTESFNQTWHLFILP